MTSDFDFSFDPSGDAPATGSARGGIPEYVNSLNDRQREAVLATEGPLIVLAGAGSGKTKMLTSRIAYLIDSKGVPAPQILAVTFTNKAAGEMRARVGKHLEGSNHLGSPEIGTFHSVCVRILRREMKNTPFTEPFVIYDDSDQLSLVKTVVQKLSIDDKAFSPKSFQHAINRAKCDALEPHDMNPSPHNFFEKQLQRVYEQYQKDLFASNALDFGEIICLVYRMLRDNPEVRTRIQRRYRYIHVDEYQDTNRAQYQLLQMMASKRHGGQENICVVGDEDQSIYKWRGADINNILDFENDYPGAQVVKLEQNYRSTKTIIAAASHVIRNNTQRKDKTLWTDNQEGILITRTQLPDERAEAELAISELKRLARDQGRAYGDFAILYRTHAQSRQFEDTLRREKIPYEIVGGLRFYDRKEIKDILSYFKVVMNKADSVSLKRIINTPARGLGKTTLDKVEAIGMDLALSGEPDSTYWAALTRATTAPDGISAATAKKLKSFTTFIEKLREQAPKLMLSELYHLILDETGYVAELRKEGTEEATSRIENLEEFDTLLQEFEEDQLQGASDDDQAKRKPELLPLFLEQSSLASDADGKKGEVPTESVVKLMSLHGCKGLEFPVVFLVGMEEGLFPSIRPWEETPDEDIEEERRLCYVGMTRAEEVLYLMHVVVRRIWGNVSYQEPSRFFEEIPQNLLEYRDFSQGAGATGFRAGSSRGMNLENVSGRGTRSKIDWDTGSQISRDEDDVDAPPTKPGIGSAGWRDGLRDPAKKPTKPNKPSNVIPIASYLADQSVIGQRIQHPDYGVGTIIATDGSGNDTKVTIEFKGRDRRKFLFRFIKALLEE